MLAAVLFGPALARELVRRQVEQALTRALGGPARVGAVESLRPSSLMLGRVHAERTSRVPFLDALQAERVRVVIPGGLWRVGREEAAVQVEGLTLVVPAASGDADLRPVSTGNLRWPAARIAVVDARVRFEDGARRAELRFSGGLALDASGPAGSLRFEAASLPVAPLAALAPLPAWLSAIEEGLSLRELGGQLMLARDRAVVELAAPGGRLDGEPEVLELGLVQASAELGFDGTGGIALSAQAPWMEELSVRLERGTGAGWRTSEARVRRADAALVQRLHPSLARWSLAGEADLELVPTPAGSPVAFDGGLRLGEASTEAGGGLWTARDAELRGRIVLGEPRRVEAARVRLGAWRWEAEDFGEIEGADWSVVADGLLAEDGSSAWTEARASGATLALEMRDAHRLSASSLQLSAPEARFTPAPDARLELPSFESAIGRAIVVEPAGRSHELRDSSGRGSAELPLDSAAGALRIDAEAAAAAYAPRVGETAPPAAALQSSRWRLERREESGPLALDMEARLGRGWGAIEAEGEVLPELRLAWRWRPDSLERVLDDWVGEAAPPLELRSLSVDGALDSKGMRARATGTGWRWPLGESAWLGGERLLVDLLLGAGEEALRFEAPTAAAGLRLPGRPEAVALEGRFAGRWRLGGDETGPVVDELSVLAGGLGRWSGRADLAAGTGTVTWTEGRLADWVDLLLSEPPEWWPARVEGELSGPLSWSTGPEETLELRGEVELRRAGFESAAGDRIAAGARGRFAATGRWDPGSGRLALAARSEDFGGFELLWGSLYGDWSEQQAGLALSVATTPGFAGVERAALALRPDADSRLEVELEPAGERWSLSAELPSLERTWPALLRERVQGLGAWQELELAGGLRVELAGGAGGSGEEIVGSVQLDALSAGLPSRSLALGGVHLELPVDLHRVSEEPGWAGPERAGRLQVEELTARGLTAEPLRSTLQVSGDSLALSDALVLPLFGGRAVLEQVGLAGLLSSEPRLTGRLTLHGVDLDRASAALGLPPAEGRLEADFGEAVLTPSRLSLAGRATADLFDGRVELVGLSVSDPLGPVPETSLDVEVVGLDLARLTGRLGFGLVTGRLDGRVDGLVLQGSRPVRFDARFRTSTEERAKRVISVQAAQNITALGSGGSGDVFDRAWLRFFDRYEYDRAGFEAELNHGVIRLSGTERRGDLELFVKGGFPLRLDVVNADPGRLLSYEGLLERVKNLDLEDVRIQRGRPETAGGSEP